MALKFVSTGEPTDGTIASGDVVIFFDGSRLSQKVSDNTVTLLGGIGDLLSANNLSDIANATTALTNLGITDVGSGAIITVAERASLGSGGGFSVVTDPSSPYIPSTQDFIEWDCSGGNKIVNLPVSSSDFSLSIKKTDISNNTITINGNGGELIDGVTTAIITSQHESISLIGNGTGWLIY